LFRFSIARRVSGERASASIDCPVFFHWLASPLKSTPSILSLASTTSFFSSTERPLKSISCIRARSAVAFASSVVALARNSDRSEGTEGITTYLTSVALLVSGNLAGSMKSSSTKRRPVARPPTSSWAQALVDEGLERPAVGDVQVGAPLVLDRALVELAEDRGERLAGVLVVADGDPDDVPHPHAAQLDRRALVQAADPLVEVDHEALRLREEAEAADRDQRDDPDAEGAEHEGADDCGADLGFHAVSGRGIGPLY
jgi:hypothetical protein